MKYFIIAITFVFAAFAAQAQTIVPHVYTYKPKRWNDSLQMFYPELQLNNTIAVQTQNNMPVLELNNNGVKIGSNNLGNIYTMNSDNMPCLKPYPIKDVVATVEVKPVLPAILKK